MEERFLQQLKKGVLELLVLQTICRGPTYGYELIAPLGSRARRRRRALGGDVVQVYLNQTFRYPNRDHKKQPLLFFVPALRRNAGCIPSDT